MTIDCARPAALAGFWNEALGWGGVAELDGGHGAVCGPPGGRTYLEFTRVPEGKVAHRYRNVVLRDPEGNEFCLAGGAVG